MKASTVLLDAVVWTAMQITVAKAFLAIPLEFFARRLSTARVASTELMVYRDILRIRAWKAKLPDGGSWLGSAFSKQRILSKDPAYLRTFAAEASRGEATHWTAILCGALFLPFNPKEAWPILFLCAIVLNAPCIIVQRYNRQVVMKSLETHAPSRPTRK